ncbi:MAG: hypothetical protein PHQ46_10750 [Negativicutes bacterium]|nr:hypothetical protein [Negativicutes bacterium]
MERHGEDAGLIGRIPITFGADDPLTTAKLSDAFSILGKELTAENLIRIFVERPDVVGGGNCTVNVYEGCKVDGETERYALMEKTITVAEVTGVQVKADDIAGIGYGTGNIKSGAIFAAEYGAWDGESHAYVVGDKVVNDTVRYICTVNNTSAAGNEPGSVDISTVTDWADATEYAANDYVEAGSARYKCKGNHTSNADNEPGAVTAGEVAAWVADTEYAVGDYVSHNAKYYRCLTVHTSAAGDEPDDGASAATNWVEVSFWDTYWDAVDLWDEFWAEFPIIVNVALYRR